MKSAKFSAKESMDEKPLRLTRPGFFYVLAEQRQEGMKAIERTIRKPRTKAGVTIVHRASSQIYDSLEACSDPRVLCY